MKKLVFIDYPISGVHVSVGVLSIESVKHDRMLVIKDLDNGKKFENCIPVPKCAEPHIFNNWKETLKKKIIWPLPKNYIRSIVTL